MSQGETTMSRLKWNRGAPHCTSTGSYECGPSRLLCGSISEFHTKRLEAATLEINLALEQAKNSDPDRPPGADLSILGTPNGLFLAWTQSSDEGVAIDNEDEIRQVLGAYDCSPDTVTIMPQRWWRWKQGDGSIHCSARGEMKCY